MRVFRTILGMLLLTIGLPALLGGAGLWTAMQHRDAGGAYSATLQTIAAPGYAIVVDDLDALVRTDAPFARVGDTRLRITGSTANGPAFIGIAPAADAARYLDGVARSRVDGVDLGTGALPVPTTRLSGYRPPAGRPADQPFWLASGTSVIDWKHADIRDRAYSVIIMNAAARPGVRLDASVEVRPGWINQTTWALVILGSLLIIAGMMVLAWPGRRREIVYVVEPSQVPELAARIGAPLPIRRGRAGLHAGNRPRTLADATSTRTAAARTAAARADGPETASVGAASLGAASRGTAGSGDAVAGGGRSGSHAAPAAPGLTWPPPPPSEAKDAKAADGEPTTTAAHRSTTATRPAAASAAPLQAAPTTAAPTAAAPAAAASTATGVSAQEPTTSGRPLGNAAQPAAQPAGTPAAAPAGVTDGIGPVPTAAAAPPATTPPAKAQPLLGARPAAQRAGRRRASEQPAAEGQAFQASAVGAWVAETAATRAREVQARAAAAQPGDPAGTQRPDDKIPSGTPTRASTAAVTANSATSTAPISLPTGPAGRVAAPGGPAVPAAAPGASAAPPVPAGMPGASTAGSIKTVPAPGAPTAQAAPGTDAVPTAAAAPAAGAVPTAPAAPAIGASAAAAPTSAAEPVAHVHRRPDEPAGNRPAVVAATTAEVPATRAPGAERRRSRRADEDSQPGPTAETTTTAGPVGSRHNAAADSPAGDGEASAVPAARVSDYQQEAKELLEAGAVGAEPGRRRRRAAGASAAQPGPAEPQDTAKGTRATRRPTQAKPSAKD